MDLSVSSATAIEKVATALADVANRIEAQVDAALSTPGAIAQVAEPGADAATALVRGGFVERILGETQNTVSAAPAQAPGENIDHAIENANMQTFARPHAPVSQPLPSADTALPTNHNAGSEFALPASLLMPATLIGLQVQHAATWQMPARGFDPDPAPLHQARVRERDPAPPPPPVEEETDEEPEQAAPEPAVHAEKDELPGGVVLDDEDDGAWCEELTRVLRIALDAKIPPHALVLAAEQWQRGRCVVLACPQGADPGGPAWAFVLWPRRQATRRADGSAAPLALFGLRVDARLHWPVAPKAAWCHVRVMKQHHPATGRQLIAASADASGRVSCEVQLGPVLARPLRYREVCLRINAVRRFWSALGAQWSMQVAVSAFPLLDATVVENTR